jgi:hypothetical protein
MRRMESNPMHIGIYMCVYAYVCIYMYNPLSIDILICMYIYAYIHIYVLTNKKNGKQSHAYRYTCMYI